MYILKNAWKSIVRNKGRNFLMMIIALVIALSACLSLSIRQASIKAKEDTLSSLTVNAQLSFDRTSMMNQMREEAPPEEGNSGQGKPDRGRFDFDALQGTALTLEDYLSYAELLGEEDSYNYNTSVSLNATDDLLPYGTEESEETEETNNNGNMGNGFGGPENMPEERGRMQASGDFSLTGFSDYTAMLSMFGNDGSYSITDGAMFSEDGDAYECIISDELAMYNEISVNDTITLVNPDCEKETYEFKVTGIYTNASSDAGNSRFAAQDPANKIYTNATALNKLLSASEEAANVADDDEDTSAVLSGETQFSYVLSSAENYDAWAKKVEEKGLPDNYVLSSSDLSAYEESIAPLETLSTMTGWFFLIVLIIGGIILVVLNIFNLRERKYEVGVLTAIGMKKGKVALQFVCELFLITFAAMVIGTGIGAAVSVPVTNSLLETQVAKVQEADQQVTENFGMKEGGDPQSFNRRGMAERNPRMEVTYIDSVSSATDLHVVLQLVLVGILLTIVSSLAALITIMRYEPLKILFSRS